MAGWERTMRKHISLAMRLSVAQHLDQEVLTIHVQPPGLKDCCLGLSLFKEGLIKSLIFTELGGTQKLDLQMDENMNSSKPVACPLVNGHQVILPLNTLDYLLHFFLKYYRDGFAEVDHVDLEAVKSGIEGGDFSITVSVSEAAPPVTGEDAIRRLKLI